MPKVLVVGENQSLLHTRVAVLERTGAEIMSCTGKELAGDLDGIGSVDVLVVCHTVPAQQRAELIAQARRRWPGIGVLQLARFHFESLSPDVHPDAFAVSTDPADVIAGVREMLRSGTTSSDNKSMRYRGHMAVLERGASGDWRAFVPGLPRIACRAETRQEVEVAVRHAVDMYVEDGDGSTHIE